MHTFTLRARLRLTSAAAALCIAFAAIFSACLGSSNGVSNEPDGAPGESGADSSAAGDSALRDATPFDAGVDSSIDATAPPDGGTDALLPPDDGGGAADAPPDVFDAGPDVFDAGPQPTDIAARIYYTRPPDGDAGNALGSIWYVDATGEHRLVEGYGEIVSPDGRYMLFHGPTSNSGSAYFSAREDVWLYDLSLGTTSDLFHNGDFTVGFDFTTDSPYRVVFDNECSILVMNLDGSGVMNINGSNCYNDEPNVRRTDGLVVYHDYTLNPSAYTMTITGADVTGISNVSSTNGPTFATVWSPGGAQILFAQLQGTSSFYGDYYVIGFDGGVPTQLTNLLADAGPDSGIPIYADGGHPPQGMTQHAAWAPDGSHVVFGGSVGATVGMFALAMPPTGAGPYALPIEGEIDWVGAVTNKLPPFVDAGAGGDAGP